jgi:hypothetical protein
MAKAFTIVSDKGVLKTLESMCSVSRAREDVLLDSVPSHAREVLALWDTGATNSMISEKVARELGLVSTGFAPSYNTTGFAIVNKYDINIYLPCGIIFTCCPVLGGTFNNIELLIGMDVMAYGDFALSHPNGQTKFTFQVPSTHDFDFHREINNLTPQNH